MNSILTSDGKRGTDDDGGTGRTGSASSARQLLLVRRVAQLDRCTLGIEWADGHRSHWRLSSLRRECPCASCVDERSGERTLDPATVDDDMLATEVESVGRYALRVRFSDGHQTGIYTLKRLRELCECEACRSARER